MNVIQKLGLVLLGPDALQKIITDTKKEALAEQTTKQLGRIVLDRHFGKATVEKMVEAFRILESEKNVVKQRAAITKVVQDHKEVHRVEAAVIVDILIALNTANIFKQA